MDVSEPSVVEEPIWFGPEDRPLFGWLVRPTESPVRGGVLLAPPVGREARGARRTLRRLARQLAARDFITLRFDYDGTGDSSGAFNDPDRERAWIDSVAHAMNLLQSMGSESVSAVGMRLGATLVGVAAQRGHGFASMVLWDPCESGRSYLRELGALESLRQESFERSADGSIETAEFVFSHQSVEELRRVNLADLGPGPLADRVLVLSREDRPVSEKLMVRLNEENVDWETTGEQAALLDVEPLKATVPTYAIERIVDWLCAAPSISTPLNTPSNLSETIVAREVGRCTVRERIVEIGPRRLFGIVTEPEGVPRGPLIIFLNVANEDHSGPSRLWVETSRRWAGFGLRCLRFDVSGIGDSPFQSVDRESWNYPQSAIEDVVSVARILSPDDPSDVVFVGLCSGAFLSLEGALAVHARGVCIINSPVCTDLLHFISRMERSRLRIIQLLAVQLKQVALRLRWVGAGLWDVFRHLVPASLARNLMATIAQSGADMLVLASTDDVAPYSKIPLLRSIDRYRLFSNQAYKVDFVPGLDHSMHNASGRANAMELLDQFVLSHYAGETTANDSAIEPTKGL